jgi:hypothetical protein
LYLSVSLCLNLPLISFWGNHSFPTCNSSGLGQTDSHSPTSEIV